MAEPEDLSLIDHFIGTLRVERGYRPLTCECYRRDLVRLANFLSRSGMPLARGNREALVRFLGHLMEAKARSATIRRHLSSVRQFYRFLAKDGLIRDNPAVTITFPRPDHSLPHPLGEAEVRRLLDATARDPSREGQRDHFLILLLYATGLRISEALSLTSRSINLQEPFIKVRGKGNRERWVPVAETVLAATRRYLATSRPLFPQKLNILNLFLNSRGGALSRQSAFNILRKWAIRAEITKTFSPHQLRHSAATHMLNHGAHLRALQEFLGHKSIASTQVYTHVEQETLKSAYRKFHPRGKKS